MAGIRDSKTVDGVTYNYLTLDGMVVCQTYGGSLRNKRGVFALFAVAQRKNPA